MSDIDKMRKLKSLNPAGFPDSFHAEIVGKDLIGIEKFDVTTVKRKRRENMNTCNLSELEAKKPIAIDSEGNLLTFKDLDRILRKLHHHLESSQSGSAIPFPLRSKMQVNSVMCIERIDSMDFFC